MLAESVSKLQFYIHPGIDHHFAMRTTVNLDDDILRVADKLAESRAISREEAISGLARRGVRRVHQPLPIKLRNGFAVLDTGGARTFSSDDVTSALNRWQRGARFNFGAAISERVKAYG
jgi:hypothetical protein